MIGDMKQRLGRALGWDIDWQTADDVHRGLYLLASASSPFDLVIADLMFPRGDLPDLDDAGGLELIGDASRRSSHTFILAISTGRDQLPDLMDDARRAGANHVARRNEFSTTS